MPETPPSQFRLSRLVKRRLKAMALKLDKPESEVVELALTHFAGTLAAGEKGYFEVPGGDDDPAQNGAAKTSWSS